jgi:hypothetical protein
VKANFELLEIKWMPWNRGSSRQKAFKMVWELSFLLSRNTSKALKRGWRLEELSWEVPRIFWKVYNFVRDDWRQDLSCHVQFVFLQDFPNLMIRVNSIYFFESFFNWILFFKFYSSRTQSYFYYFFLILSFNIRLFGYWTSKVFSIFFYGVTTVSWI